MALTSWIVCWIGLEYLHLNWELAFPWLNLGNGMASLPYLIQWYEYTGSTGGSLWILGVNALVFYHTLNRNRKTINVAAVFLMAPVIISFILYFSPEVARSLPGEKVVIVQPNIDPYLKFEEEDPAKEVKYLTSLAEKSMSEHPLFVLFPETAITEFCEEKTIDQTQSYHLLRKWLSKHPGTTLISGSNTYTFYDSIHKTSTSRKHFSGLFYDVFNSSLVVDSNGVKNIYRKSKLVPGVEKMPYTGVFGFLENMAIDLGGISGSLGSDSVVRVFYSEKGIGAAPLICYESIFGEYASKFVLKGASLIFVLSNDGWWGNTPGYKQHKQYASLRAIENRRDVVRCTNTGTSCMINKKGIIQGETEWWKAESRSYTVQPSAKLTFYSQHGDYIGKCAAYLCFFIPFLLYSGFKFKK